MDMIEIISFVLLITLSLLLSRLRTVYCSTPANELSVRSREGDKQARQLHLVAKYGESVSLAFYIIIFLIFSGGIVMSDSIIGGLGSYVFNVIYIFVVFFLIPNTRNVQVCTRLAVYLAPYVAKVLSWVHPFCKQVLRLWHRITVQKTIKLTKEDFLEFLEAQKNTDHPSLDSQQVESILRILQNSKKQIKDVMLHLDDARIVSAADQIGPILIDELHKTGQGWFPVRQPKKKNIVGFFYIHDLLARSEGGEIADVMDTTICYLHEKQPLWTAIDAFVQTKSQIFLVINSEQKILGIVSVECILNKLLGDLEQVGAESYDDPDTVSLY